MQVMHLTVSPSTLPFVPLTTSSPLFPHMLTTSPMACRSPKSPHTHAHRPAAPPTHTRTHHHSLQPLCACPAVTPPPRPPAPQLPGRGGSGIHHRIPAVPGGCVRGCLGQQVRAGGQAVGGGGGEGRCPYLEAACGAGWANR